jgi:NitT/TauT family transport system permease protein
MEDTNRFAQLPEYEESETFDNHYPWRVFLRRNENRLLAIGTFVCFLILWELLPRLGLVKPLFTSSPTRIIKAATWLFARGFWFDIYISALEFVIGFGLAVIIGIPLGFLLGWNQRIYAMFDPFISALNATPRVAMLPLVILWLGIGVKSIVAVVFLGAVFPLLVNAITGVRNVDENLLLCAHSFGAKDRQILISLALPASIPFLIAGMRLAVGRALVGVVVGELVASRAGIGHMMSKAGATFQTDKFFVGVVILALSGYFLTEVFKHLETHFESWRP